MKLYLIFARALQRHRRNTVFKVRLQRAYYRNRRNGAVRIRRYRERLQYLFLERSLINVLPQLIGEFTRYLRL
jgi:hypothetical protein